MLKNTLPLIFAIFFASSCNAAQPYPEDHQAFARQATPCSIVLGMREFADVSAERNTYTHDIRVQLLAVLKAEGFTNENIEYWSSEFAVGFRRSIGLQAGENKDPHYVEREVEACNQFIAGKFLYFRQL